MHFYLVTTYNHVHYFPKMLASIRRQYATKQEYDRNARILVIDDASPDETGKLLRETARANRNIEVFLNPTNRGVGHNRNFLLNWLSSRSPSPDDFVLFVDGDDVLPEGSIERKLSVFDTDPTLEVVGGQLGLFFGDDIANIVPVDTFPVDPEVLAIANIFECHFYISNALFRASVFLNPTVRFPETPTSEDWLFFALYPLRKRHVPEVTLHYRRHDNNLTNLPATSEAVFTLRRQTRSLGLLRIGMLPSARDCELLDLVGYLSFRLRWFGAGHTYDSTMAMPWFGLLSRKDDVRQNWEALRTEVSGLFDRIIAHNDRVPALDKVKLAAYCNAILQAADTEVASGT
jgi:glycosyltransferase involved in cell wall biosynthesis